jgi:hypothetical protein
MGMATNTFEQAIIAFQEAAPGFSEGGPIAIDTALAPLMQHHDWRCIRPLLFSLDDAYQEDAGMFSIIHAVESFDDDIYVSEFLGALPQLWSRAPKWASIALMRGLNNEHTKDVIVRKLREVDSDVKQSVVRLCEKINERSPSFLNKTLPVLLAAK